MFITEAQYLDTLISMISKEPSQTNLLPIELLTNKDFIIRLVTCNKDVLLQLPKTIMDDLDIMSAALRSDGLALKYAPDRIRDDIDMVQLAIQSNGDAIRYAGSSLRDNKTLVMEALRTSRFNLEYVSTRLQDDFDVVSIALTKWGDSLEVASSRLRDDKDIVSIAVSQAGVSLRHASSRLRNDKDICMLAVSSPRNGRALEYVSPELKLDFEIVSKAVKNSSPALQYVDKIFNSDLRIILDALFYAPDNMRDLRRLNERLLERAEVKFIITPGVSSEISETEWPLVKKALLEQPDRFLNPPDIIRELSEGLPNKYVLLAQHALGETNEYEVCQLPYLI